MTRLEELIPICEKYKLPVFETVSLLVEVGIDK